MTVNSVKLQTDGIYTHTGSAVPVVAVMPFYRIRVIMIINGTSDDIRCCMLKMVSFFDSALVVNQAIPWG